MFCPAIFRIEINLNSQWMFSIGLPFLDDGDGCDDDDDEMTIMIATTRVIKILKAKSNKKVFPLAELNVVAG